MGSQSPDVPVVDGKTFRNAGPAMTRTGSKPLENGELNASPRFDWRQ